ncbi:hypothetical protein [Arthrobacter sp. SAFR-044]|uniref:hypothetical protein n=1 Tax=Arthrobacter sp. SAFR-044 TaxID=3387278 RepID=UPI003F7CBB26
MKSGIGASAIVSAMVDRLRRKEGVSAGASDGGRAASAAISPELDAAEGPAAIGAAAGLPGAGAAEEEGDAGAAAEGTRDGLVASAAAAASAQELRRVTGFPASFGLEGGVTVGMVPVQAS